MRRLGLSAADARRELGHLLDLGLLLPRKARDDGSYQLSSRLPQATTGTAIPGNGIGSRILAALNDTEPATREELQRGTGTSRSGVTRALDELIANGLIEATAPPRSPSLSRRDSLPVSGTASREPFARHRDPARPGLSYFAP